MELLYDAYYGNELDKDFSTEHFIPFTELDIYFQEELWRAEHLPEEPFNEAYELLKVKL